MIVVDANILLYAYDRGSSHHEASKAWLETALRGPEQVGFPLVTVLAFLRIVTHPKVFERPLRADDAFSIVASWLELPTAALVQPTERHIDVFRRIAVDGQARGALITDAHLAALSVEHGAALCTTDRDFRRFAGLRLIDPLG